MHAGMIGLPQVNYLSTHKEMLNKIFVPRSHVALPPSAYCLPGESDLTALSFLGKKVRSILSL